jgi:hypothetical protein
MEKWLPGKLRLYPRRRETVMEDKLADVLFVIRTYQEDLEAMTPKERQELCETLDAFLCDLKISNWKPEAVGYGL